MWDDVWGVVRRMTGVGVERKRGLQMLLQRGSRGATLLWPDGQWARPDPAIEGCCKGRTPLI